QVHRGSHREFGAPLSPLRVRTQRSRPLGVRPGIGHGCGHTWKVLKVEMNWCHWRRADANLRADSDGSTERWLPRLLGSRPKRMPRPEFYKRSPDMPLQSVESDRERDRMRRGIAGTLGKPCT